jgi:CubicO group peptidase (beta-lactamase class C family)
MMNGIYELPRSTPEEQGVSSRAVLAFLEEAEKLRTKDMSQDFHSFMLLRHGYVIAEGWWKPYESNTPHVLFSLSKSFTSTAIGFAVQEGLLTVEDRVVTYFKEECPEPGSNLAAMKVKDLLSMSTGHVVDTTSYMMERDDGDWVRGFLEVPVEKEPGTYFLYNTGATYMLSVILQKLTGMKLIDYLRPRLLEQLGIEGATWDNCPRGYNTGGFGLRVRTEDIAKFGQLYLKEGMLGGKQLLSREWIKEATSIQSDNSRNGDGDWGQGYGYQFWRCRHQAYRGDGAFGQYCVVMPKQDMVLAITGGMRDLQMPLEIAWEKLLPGVTEHVLTEGSDYQELKDKLAHLKLMLPDGSTNSPMEGRIAGRRYKLEENQFQFNQISFEFREGIIDMSLEAGQQEERYPVGTGQWTFGKVFFQGNMEPAAFTGIWEKEDTLLIQWRLTAMPFGLQLRIQFTEQELVLEMKINVGFGEPQPERVKGECIG